MGLGLIIGGIAASTLGNMISGVLGAKAQKEAADILNESSAEQLQMFKNYYDQAYGAGSYNSIMQNLGLEAASRYNDILNDEDAWDKYINGERAFVPREEFSFTKEDLLSDPSYDFRLNEGLDEVEQSAIAGGLSRSGIAAKALNNFAQDVASQEYAKAFDRAFGEYKDQRDFDYSSWKDEMLQYYNNLNTMLNGNNSLMQSGNNASDNQTQALTSLGNTTQRIKNNMAQADSQENTAGLVAGAGVVNQLAGFGSAALNAAGQQEDKDAYIKQLEVALGTANKQLQQNNNGTALG